MKKHTEAPPVGIHSTLSPFDSAAIIWSHRLKLQLSLPFDVEGAESLTQGKLQSALSKWHSAKRITVLLTTHFARLCPLACRADLFAPSKVRGKLFLTDHFSSICSSFSMCKMDRGVFRGVSRGVSREEGAVIHKILLDAFIYSINYTWISFSRSYFIFKLNSI